MQPSPPQTYLTLDEITHDFIVEVVDRAPGDSFCDVFLLFCLQRELDEDLLKFLVHKVDAELFESVFLLVATKND